MKTKNDVLLEKVIELLKDSTKSKSDIVEFLVVNNAEDLSIEDIKKSQISEIETANNIISGGEFTKVELDKNGNFTIVDIPKLDKETKLSFQNITKEEARFLVDIYYQTQKKRIVVDNQIRSIIQEKDTNKSNKNLYFLSWYSNCLKTMEKNIKYALDIFSESNYLSKWAKANIGIGPTISSCLVAGLEFRENSYAGSWWSYCGLNDNNRPWLGKEKSKEIVETVLKENNDIIDDNVIREISLRTQWSEEHIRTKGVNDKGILNKSDIIKACSIIPYNKDLKLLMYKIGESFVKVQNKEGSLYGRLYKERLAYETKLNEEGAYKDQALKRSKEVGVNTIAYKYYKEGKLPPAHIIQRCKRYVTKLFISHFWEAAYYNYYGTKAPNPYILKFSEGEHNRYIEPEVPFDSIDRD